jgi:hypothetical protein
VESGPAVKPIETRESPTENLIADGLFVFYRYLSGSKKNTVVLSVFTGSFFGKVFGQNSREFQDKK